MDDKHDFSSVLLNGLCVCVCVCVCVCQCVSESMRYLHLGATYKTTLNNSEQFRYYLRHLKTVVIRVNLLPERC